MEFRGTDRFAVIRHLGSGGMGAVYEALDRERNERVALKTLHRLDPRLLYRLKTEFRVLQDLHHPNLIKLGQLMEDSGNWFFTMELIDGIDFLRYIRSPAREKHPTLVELPRAREEIGQAQTVDVDINDEFSEIEGVVHTPPDGLLMFDESLLRQALGGVVEGLHALHRSGVIHCDVKPSNILVTRQGRVVLLDFGLAHDMSQSSDSGQGRLIGTPAYMAPELVDGAAADAASDWYGLGVTLYQALTGSVPFRGNPVDMMVAKVTTPPVRPSKLIASVPTDLDSLCMLLLRPNPLERPSGRQLVTQLTGTPSAEIISRSGANAMSSFVGRHTELDVLRDSLDSVREGAPVVVYVNGRSGLGKTALIECFLARERDKPSTVVLSGRCYERESVPYKALDHLVDGLTNYLRTLSDAEVGALIPRHVAALVSVFPVLDQVDAIARAPRVGDSADPRERRGRAFSALKELLARLGDRRRLILFIDDLQWGDLDSAALLCDLVRQPDPPAMLLIGAYRAEDAESAVVNALPGRGSLVTSDAVREFSVEPLSAEDGHALAMSLVGGSPDADERVESIVREAGGSPLFVAEIARHLEATHQPALPESSRTISLDDVISRRVERLPTPARRLLEVIAAIGRPIEAAFVIRAAELTSGGDAALAMLSSANLVATHSADKRVTVESFHDRIRETVARTIQAERLDMIKARVAELVEESEWVDAELVALDLGAAGGSKAYEYTVAAALRAEKALAFDRAASLYQQAMAPAPAVERPKLRRKRADVLTYGGRYLEAAREYLILSEHAEGEDKVDLIRRAADNFLRGGHVEDGLARLGEVMGYVGVKLPRGRTGLLLSLIGKRIRLATRGLKYTPRDEADIPAAELSRLDTLFAASTSLAMIDHLRGSAAQAQHLLRALRLGEPTRATAALCTEVTYLAVQGGGAMRKASALADELVELATERDDHYLLGGALIAKGSTLFFSGEFAAASDVFRAADEHMGHVVGSWWERNTVRFFLCLANLNMGNFSAFVPTVKQALELAERRNDAYVKYLYQCHPNVWCAMHGDSIDQAEKILDGVLDGWPDGTHYQAHYTVMVSKVMCRLYRGDGEGAGTLIDESMPMLRALMVPRLPFVMGEVNKLAARAAILRGDWRRAYKLAKKQDSIGIAVSHGMSAALRAPIALHDGKNDEARALLERSIECYETCGAAHLVAAAKYRLGGLIAGDAGAALRAEALGWMRDQGVVAPEKLIDFATPGYAE